MELTDSFTFPVDRQSVWNALNDPEVLKSCIAGCESFDRVGENEFACAVMAGVGPVKARFASRVTLSGIDAPYGYTLSFDGQGGAAGFGRGAARVNLSEEAGGTRLTYTAHAQVGGKLVQAGSLLIDVTAKQMTDDFFALFSARLGGSRVVPAAAATATITAGLGRPHTRIPLWLIAVGAIGLVTIVYLFTHP